MLRSHTLEDIVRAWSRGVSAAFTFRIIKNDPSGKHYAGTKFHFPQKSDSSLACPVAAHLLLLWCRPGNHLTPLFHRHDGRALTRHAVGNGALGRLPLGWHSARVGGANALVAAGVDVATVMILARWRSADSFRTYLRSQRSHCESAMRNFMAPDQSSGTIEEALRLLK